MELNYNPYRWVKELALETYRRAQKGMQSRSCRRKTSEDTLGYKAHL